MLPQGHASVVFAAEPYQTRIVLVGLGTLLDDSLLQFLQQAADFSVEVLPFADMATSLHDLKRLGPDIVILNTGGSLDLITLVAALFAQPQFVSLRVFGVHPDTNFITVCTKSDLVLSEGRQLLALLRQSP
jgi:hypothetical protein